MEKSVKSAENDGMVIGVNLGVPIEAGLDHSI